MENGNRSSAVLAILSVGLIISCVSQDQCQNVICGQVCREQDLWEQQCSEGECVDYQIIEEDAVECGYDPVKKEEYRLYSALLETGLQSFGGDLGTEDEISVIVIEDHTCWCLRTRYLYGASGQCDSVIEELPALKQETYDDFEAKNKDPQVLDGTFTVSVPVIVLSEEDIEALFDTSDWGQSLLEKYNSKAILTLSRIGFDTEMNQALVYAGIYTAWNAGIGYYVLLNKENGVWEVESTITAWIS
jgi:hypothetical protein